MAAATFPSGPLIQRVDLGPTLPPPVPPTLHVVPRMGLPVAREAGQRVWRVTEPELGEIVDWLIPRLKERHPRLAEEGLVSGLRAAFTDPHAIFARAGDVVGYFMVQRTILDTEHPFVVERFVRAKAPSNEDAVLLYQYVRDIGHAMNASEFHFNVDSDAAMVQHVNPGMHDPKRHIRTRKESRYIAILRDLTPNQG